MSTNDSLPPKDVEVVPFALPFSSQGDLNIFPATEIPNDAVKSEGGTKVDSQGNYILAHSETGHNHVMSGEGAEVYDVPDDEFVSYINVKDTSRVVHLRSYHTHKTIELPPGQYRITRQREYTPEGFRRAQD